MEEVNLDVSKFKIKLGDMECVIDEPSLFEFEDYLDKINDKKGNEIRKTKEFFQKIGVDEKILKKMTAKHMKQILDSLQGKLQVQ